jgi:uncharacterized protein with HEPN domain
MFDRALILGILGRIASATTEVVEWTDDIGSAADFYSSSNGMIKLNAVCMKLLAIGEDVKNLDKRTGHSLLSNYPAIPWKNVMGLRDIIAHHYFDVDADEIFTVITVDIPPLAEAVRQIKADIEAIEQE